jgi:hypothetical protein
MDSEQYKELTEAFRHIGNWRNLTPEEADQLLLYMSEGDREAWQKWFAQEETAKTLEQMNPEQLPPHITKLLRALRK